MTKSITESFRKNPDGSWTSIEPFVVVDADGTEIRVSEGIHFRRGTLLMGTDWSRYLDKQMCSGD